MRETTIPQQTNDATAAIPGDDRKDRDVHADIAIRGLEAVIVATAHERVQCRAARLYAAVRDAVGDFLGPDSEGVRLGVVRQPGGDEFLSDQGVLALVFAAGLCESEGCIVHASDRRLHEVQSLLHRGVSIAQASWGELIAPVVAAEAQRIRDRIVQAAAGA